MLALIPVKSLDTSKQRLADVLPGNARRRLSIAVLGDVLDTLRVHAAIDRVLLASADRQVAVMAHDFNVGFLDEAELACSGLNGTVNAVAARLAQEGVTRLMVVHGDLPLLSRDELSRFVATHAAAAAPAVTLTPDGRRDGTNLLAWNPASAFRADYGQGSFARHCNQCHALGMVPTVCVLPGAGFDIDLAEDFTRLKTLREGLGPRTSALLADREFKACADMCNAEALRR